MPMCFVIPCICNPLFPLYIHFPPIFNLCFIPFILFFPFILLNMMNMHHHGISIYALHSLLLLLFLSPSLLQFAMATSSSSSSPPLSVDEDDYNFNTSHVNPSITLIIAVVVVIFFITGFIAVYINQCSDSSAGAGAQVAATGGRFSRRGNVRGLENSVIETFPTFLYSEVKELKIRKGSLECAVCLNEFEEDETLRLLPKCDHVFHSECIDAWLAGHSTCPVCRANLAPNPSQIDDSDESIHQVEMADLPSDEGVSTREVRIAIDDVAEVKEDRKVRVKFPRSHSTGHSVSQARGVDSERYTLKLPAEVWRQLMARTRLKRATSLVALPRVSSSRRGYRGGGEGSGSSRYGGGIIGRSMMRMVSFRWAYRGRDEGDVTVTEMSKGSTSSKRILGTAVTPV